MSATITELRAMSDEKLIREHDEVALHTSVGVDYYLGELRRREAQRQTATVVRLTWAIFFFTVVVAVATLLLLIRSM